MKPQDHNDRMTRARVALDGLSIGDAFGQQFFSPNVRDMCLSRRELPMPRWRYTDDTAMALGIGEVLDQFGRIDQDALAVVFARRFQAEPDRGYGLGARELLAELARGGDWRALSKQMFGGQGSFGNGAAMRVAPVGAYFADELAEVVNAARRSAEITHAHPEGIAGAIAVAVAVARASRCRERGEDDSRELLVTVRDHTPPSVVRDGIEKAIAIPADEWEHTAAGRLGNGSQVSAADTVPFCLWCAAVHLTDFPAAMWAAVQVGGDIDTNCAIIGGIVASTVGAECVPDAWLRSREPLWLRSDR
jgi:ADP-ribosylglycohydrolase